MSCTSRDLVSRAFHMFKVKIPTTMLHVANTNKVKRQCPDKDCRSPKMSDPQIMVHRIPVVRYTGADMTTLVRRIAIVMRYSCTPAENGMHVALRAS